MMTAILRRAVVLYGPPASGKSTVTEYLGKLDARYCLFPRLKAGPGRTAEYRLTSLDHINSLRTHGDAVWVNERYGAVYAVDRPYIRELVDAGRVPVLHAGQRQAVDAIVAALPDARVTRVSLTCPRIVAERRISDRGMGDAAERLAAYDATESFPDADLTIDTSAVDPSDAADLIAHKVFS